MPTSTPLILPVVVLSFAPAGFVCALLATYHYIRFERGPDDQRVAFAIAAFGVQYALAFGLSYVRHYLLLPMLVMFLMTVALVAVIWLGFQARSKAGTRVASAAVLTLVAYACYYVAGS